MVTVVDPRFQEFTRGFPGSELGARQEEIILSVLLAVARFARGSRDRVSNTFVPLPKLGNESIFSGSGRPRHDKEQPRSGQRSSDTKLQTSDILAMVTDHLLIRRAGRELDRALRGARVRDVGISSDGSVAIVMALRSQVRVLHVAPFGTPPLVWLDDDDALRLEGEPSWLRATGTVLRGLRVTAVRARRGDRVLRVEFEGRSPFGVPDRSALVLELVPRFGNVVLLKGDTIVAAAKTFSRAENPARSVEIGDAYEPPPAPAWSVPRLLASSWPESQTPQLEALADGEGPVHVYRRDGKLVAVHLVPLQQDDDCEHASAPVLLDVFREAATAGVRAQRADRTQSQRDSLLRELRRRREAAQGRLEALEDRAVTLARRDELRRAGDAIYAYLPQIDAGASRFVTPDDERLVVELDPRLTPKENARRYFERYRKAQASQGHLQRRRASLEKEAIELDTLLWEVERADDESLSEIAADLHGKPRKRSTRRPLGIDLPSGARLYVGRSPRENAEVTFRLGRPDDLWFHARNVPGAHVVLHAAPGVEPADADIAAAARLAATNSRARGSSAVDVDYAPRKFVRKQRDGKPGMVWYTNFKTLRVAPDQVDARPTR